MREELGGAREEKSWVGGQSWVGPEKRRVGWGARES